MCEVGLQQIEELEAVLEEDTLLLHLRQELLKDHAASGTRSKSEKQRAPDLLVRQEIRRRRCVELVDLEGLEQRNHRLEHHQVRRSVCKREFSDTVADKPGLTLFGPVHAELFAVVELGKQVLPSDLHLVQHKVVVVACAR